MQTLLLSAFEGNFAVATFWAFIPAIIAIVLALITKQVYLSLFAGIFVGAMFLGNGNPIYAIGIIFEVMSAKIDVGILAFLIILGIIVVLLQKSGGSRAYGNWASTKIKSKKGALGATSALGCLIFVDDYFNCLTVGSVMRPVTDKFKISRAKLAYIIDATAAPICIIAPISSWAAAVSGEIAGNGLIVFIMTIPFNLYALLTIGFVFYNAFSNFEFGKMKKNEKAAAEGDLFAGETELPSEDVSGLVVNERGKVKHLIIPIIVLIVSCILAMVYVGYFYDWDAEILTTTFQGGTILDAFANTNSSLALAIGSTVALILIVLYYSLEKVVSFKDCMGSLTEGFKSMVPAIFILVFAWTISGIMGAKGGYLDARQFVQTAIYGSNFPLGLLPFIFFVLACAIAFATGTSWGTFGVLIPLATSFYAIEGVVPATVQVFLLVAAILSGAVFGDHISPISDTTIMASSGAQCNHVDHVKTQLPYAGLVAIISGLSFLALGFILNNVTNYGIAVVISIALGFALLALAIIGIKLIQKKMSKKDKVEELSI
jgi:Na+/H+ antiporter NhaC